MLSLANEQFGEYIKKISPKSIFIPAVLNFILIGTFGLGYIVLSRKIIGYELYSYLFVGCAGLLLLKNFIITYINLIQNFIRRKWFLFAFNLVCFLLQTGCAFYAVYSLTVTSYIFEVFVCLSIASLAFYMQCFIANYLSMLRLGITNLALYCLSTLVVYQRLFNADPRVWNLLTILAFGFELSLLFVITSHFFKEVRKIEVRE